MATVEGVNLAYLTSRKSPTDGDGSRLYEVGVAGHGPAGDRLAGRVTDAVQRWERDYRGRPARFETHPPTTEIRPGRFVGRHTAQPAHRQLGVTSARTVGRRRTIGQLTTRVQPP